MALGAIGALANQSVDEINKALLTGRLLIMPLVYSIAASMFKSYAGCQLFAAPTPEFPFGMPYLCNDKGNFNYVSSLYLYHAMKWVVIGAIAYYGKKYSKQIVVVSCATSGATLMCSSIAQFITMLLRLNATDLLAAADVGPQVNDYATIAYYILIVLGSMSQFMMRGYADALSDLDKAQKKIGTVNGFSKKMPQIIKDAPEESVKTRLKRVHAKVNSFVDGAVAEAELAMAEISPIPNISRRFMARRLKEQLANEDGGTLSTVWEHFYVQFDPTNTASGEALKTLNKKIWALKVRPPKGRCEGQLDEDGLVTMRAYHELLLSIYDTPVEKLPGKALLFKNQVLPVIWLKFLPLPHKGLNEKHGLGKDIKKTICQPPWMWLSMFVAGPPIRNDFVFSPCGFVWAYPLIKFNLAVHYVQYSSKTAAHHFDAFLSLFICYRIAKRNALEAKAKAKKMSAKFNKMSAKVNDAGAVGGGFSGVAPAAPEGDALEPDAPGMSMLDVAQSGAGGSSQLIDDPKVIKIKEEMEALKKAHAEELARRAEVFEEEKKALLEKKAKTHIEEL